MHNRRCEPIITERTCAAAAVNVTGTRDRAGICQFAPTHAMNVNNRLRPTITPVASNTSWVSKLQKKSAPFARPQRDSQRRKVADQHASL